MRCSWTSIRAANVSAAAPGKYGFPVRPRDNITPQLRHSSPAGPFTRRTVLRPAHLNGLSNHFVYGLVLFASLRYTEALAQTERAQRDPLQLMIRSQLGMCLISVGGEMRRVRNTCDRSSCWIRYFLLHCLFWPNSTPPAAGYEALQIVRTILSTPNATMVQLLVTFAGIL